MRHPDRDIERSQNAPGSRGSASSERNEVRGRDRSYRLSDSELASLRTVGTFRTVRAKEIPEDEAKHLVAAGLMQKSSVPTKDFEKLDVLVLTPEGERLLSGRQDPDDNQRFHSGLVKPRELEHDAAIYPAYKDAADAIEKAGGKVERVVLDYELKGIINSEMNRGGEVSDQEKDERRAKLADDLDLEIVDGKLPLPDLRIEYIDAEGERHHEDIEIVSRHYHSAHMASKSAAGFKMVAQGGGGGAPVPDYRRKK